MCLAPCTYMARELFCDHCERALTSKAYRVISEDPGGILLDMLVCHPCNQKARELGLKTQEVDLDERSLKRG
jgi:glutaredoxin